MLGIVWELFWELLVIVWDEFGNGLGIVSELLEIVWELFGNCLGIVWDCLEFSIA